MAVDGAGDLLIADRGNDAVREVPVAPGDYYSVPIGANDIARVAGTGAGYGPYLTDGLSATGATAALNFPSGLAVDGRGDLFVAGLYDRAIREVPAASGPSFGRAVIAGNMYTVAGALPAGADQDGTRWVRTRVTYPAGLAVGPSGSLYFTDRGADVVRVIRAVPGP